MKDTFERSLFESGGFRVDLFRSGERASKVPRDVLKEGIPIRPRDGHGESDDKLISCTR